MAANDDFPRGWNYISRLNGASPAAVVLPAVPNVAHVLTSIEAMLDAATQAVPIQVVVLDSQGNVFGDLTIPTTSPQYSKDTLSWTGKITYPMATAITIEFNTPGTNAIEVLTVQGYDI